MDVGFGRALLRGGIMKGPLGIVKTLTGSFMNFILGGSEIPVFMYIICVGI